MRLRNALLDTMHEAVFAIDLGEKVSYVNNACEVFMGMKREEILGKTMPEAFGNSPNYSAGLLTTLREKKPMDFNEVAYTRNGITKYYSGSFRLVIERDELLGAATFFNDVTEHVLKTREMQKIMGEMAVNLVPISKEMAVLPVMPIPNSVKNAQINERVIRECSRLQIQVLIIDLTAIPYTDAGEAQLFMHSVSALRLIGVEAAITGIRPEVAIAAVRSGADLGQYKTFATLKQAIEYYGAIR